MNELLKNLERGRALLTEEDSVGEPWAKMVFVRFGILRYETTSYPVVTLVVGLPGSYFIEGPTFIPTGSEKDAYCLAAYARAWAFIQATGLVGVAKQDLLARVRNGA